MTSTLVAVTLETLTTAPTKALVEFYNSYVGPDAAIKKFADRATAEKRVGALLASLASTSEERRARLGLPAEEPVASPEPVAEAPAVELTARALERARRYPSSFGLKPEQVQQLTTAAGATVTIRPAQAGDLAAIKAQILANAPKAAPVRKPASSGSASSVDAQQASFAVQAVTSAKAGTSGFFGGEFAPKARALAVDGIVTARDVFAAFPHQPRAKLVDCWVHLFKRGLAARV